MASKFPEKIVALWTVFLLGTLFHTQLGLMPLFHGLSIAHPDAQGGENVPMILWLMLGFFVLPMLAIIGTVFTPSKRYRIAHFGLTVFYSVLNLLHLVLDLFVTPIVWSQITLMGILLLIGLLLNVVSFQWMKSRPEHRSLGDDLMPPHSVASHLKTRLKND